MINAYELNEYLYCKRRYYYIKKIGLSPKNEHIEIGNNVHNSFQRSLSNLFFEDRSIGIKGKIDYLTQKDKLTLYEIKSSNSLRLWKNDKIQILCYWMLAKRNNIKINNAFVHYQNRKFEVKLTKDDEENIKNTIKEMNDLNKLPERCNNTNKCNGCNIKEFCWV